MTKIEKIAQGLGHSRMWWDMFSKQQKNYVYKLKGNNREYQVGFDPFVPFGKCIDAEEYNQEEYIQAVELLKSKGIIVGKERKDLWGTMTNHYEIMPVYNFAIHFDNGAGDSLTCYTDADAVDLTKYDGKGCVYALYGYIRIDHLAPEYKQYAYHTSICYHPSSKSDYPECDNDGNKVLYAKVDMEKGKWYIRGYADGKYYQIEVEIDKVFVK